jgi:hypothetical protein
MHPKFQKRFSVLQGLLDHYEKELKDLSFQQSNQIPLSGGWSIAQVVYHISIVEKGVIQYIQKKLINPSESKNAGLKSFYRAALLRYALRSKRKFRAPKVLDTPQGPYEVNDLIKEWKITRKELEKLFDSIADADVNRQFFKHPVVGKINLKQTLGFMADHKKRHLDQIIQLKQDIK